MPKLKTVKGVRDRFRVTGTGKVLGSRAGRRHLLSGERAKIKRKLRKLRAVSAVDAKKIKALIPYQ